MQVPNIVAGMSNLRSLVKRGDADAKSAAGAAANAAGAALASNAGAMRAIVSQYDMSDITPNQFSNMIQQLNTKGAISQKDFQELSTIRVDLETANVGPDETVNLQEFYQQQLTGAETAAAQSPGAAAAQANLQAVAAKMTWVQRFAAVGQGSGAGGVNAVA